MKIDDKPIKEKGFAIKLLINQEAQTKASRCENINENALGLH